MKNFLSGMIFTKKKAEMRNVVDDDDDDDERIIKRVAEAIENSIYCETKKPNSERVNFLF